MKNKSLRILLTITLLVSSTVIFGQAPTLGTASSFALFTANGALTNVGATVVTGDIGTNVGAFSGFPPGTVIGQTRLPGSTEANQAATDVVAAYNALTSVLCGPPIGPTLGSGQVITPGVYCQVPPAAASTLTGTLTLDGQGDPNAVFIIKLNGALTTATGSSISLANGACSQNVYFQVNGAVDLGVGSFFKGTILANGAISLLTGAALEGRGLSVAGAISSSNNVVKNQVSELALSLTTGPCNPATNQYSISGTLSLTNAVTGIAILTDGTSTTTVSVNAGDTSVPYSLTGLLSGTGSRSLSVSYACTIASMTYTAPASCTSASLGGQVYADNNNNSIRDGGDTPIQGVAVTLLDGTNSPIGSTTTTASGTYSFTGLTPGIPYSVSFTTPANYSAILAGGTTGPVTLTSGQNNSGLDIGFRALTASLDLGLFIDKSKAKIGDLLTYTLVLTNAGSSPVSNVVVTDSTTAGSTYVANSATAPAGTTFTSGAPNSSWFIATIGIGQSLSLTFQALVTSSGIIYSTATIPGDTANVCASIPIRVCADDLYTFTMTAPPGRSSYRWFKNNIEIIGEVTNVLSVTAPGTYSLATDNVVGKCPNFSCCPLIVEEDTLPTFRASAVSASCLGNAAQANGQLVLIGFNPAYTYQYSLGASFDPTASLSGSPQTIPPTGLLVNTLTNPIASQPYTVRVYNSAGCYTDVTVILTPTVCVCPADVCIPVVIQQTKRAVR